MRPKQGEPAEYPTLSAFWTARPPRRTSPEDEYGEGWHAGAASGPSWRVSYIRATREVYAVRLTEGIPGPVRLLGVMLASPGAGQHPDQHNRRMLDAALRGWDDPDISGHDLAWVEKQLAAAGFSPGS